MLDLSHASNVHHSTIGIEWEKINRTVEHTTSLICPKDVGPQRFMSRQPILRQQSIKSRSVTHDDLQVNVYLSIMHIRITVSNKAIAKIPIPQQINTNGQLTYPVMGPHKVTIIPFCKDRTGPVGRLLRHSGSTRTMLLYSRWWCGWHHRCPPFYYYSGDLRPVDYTVSHHAKYCLE